MSSKITEKEYQQWLAVQKGEGMEYTLLRMMYATDNLLIELRNSDAGVGCSSYRLSEYAIACTSRYLYEECNQEVNTWLDWKSFFEIYSGGSDEQWRAGAFGLKHGLH